MRRVFARRLRPIMAAKARTGYPCVIERRRRPAGVLVAIFAHVAGR
jgi:hypothetical protein